MQTDSIVYVDFDGTISNCKYRLYKLFCYLTESNDLSFDEYWDIKRQGIKQGKLLETRFGYSQEEAQEFFAKWLNLVERPEWLKYDEKVIGADRLLEEIKKTGADIVLVTNRQDKAQLLDQIKKYNLDGYFKEILITEHKASKVDLIREYEKGTIKYQKSYFLGDMHEDIKTANEVKAKMYLVKSEAQMVKIEYLPRIERIENEWIIVE